MAAYDLRTAVRRDCPHCWVTVDGGACAARPFRVDGAGGERSGGVLRRPVVGVGHVSGEAAARALGCYEGVDDGLGPHTMGECPAGQSTRSEVNDRLADRCPARSSTGPDRQRG